LAYWNIGTAIRLHRRQVSLARLQNQKILRQNTEIKTKSLPSVLPPEGLKNGIKHPNKIIVTTAQVENGGTEEGKQGLTSPQPFDLRNFVVTNVTDGLNAPVSQQETKFYGTIQEEEEPNQTLCNQKEVLPISPCLIINGPSVIGNVTEESRIESVSFNLVYATTNNSEGIHYKLKHPLQEDKIDKSSIPKKKSENVPPSQKMIDQTKSEKLLTEYDQIEVDPYFDENSHPITKENKSDVLTNEKHYSSITKEGQHESIHGTLLENSRNMEKHVIKNPFCGHKNCRRTPSKENNGERIVSKIFNENGKKSKNLQFEVQGKNNHLSRSQSQKCSKNLSNTNCKQKSLPDLGLNSIFATKEDQQNLDVISNCKRVLSNEKLEYIQDETAHMSANKENESEKKDCNEISTIQNNVVDLQGKTIAQSEFEQISVVKDTEVEMPRQQQQLQQQPQCQQVIISKQQLKSTSNMTNETNQTR
jgi:hypothetical protein